ncbi:MAG: four helix bundle protein [Patescibacteria group bacterium]
MKRFEDSIVWQKSKSLNIGVYKTFKDSRDFGFRDQIQRAAVSVMNNISEGFERDGNKEFRKFLFIAKGSAGEVRSMLILARELDYISPTNYRALYNLAEEVSKLLAALIKKL